ncbi:MULTISPECIES: hypothetical protein [unclassified Sulfuricurvum]|uniref:hypothetical protein n=1 Tax=unclassified Sulfuricurvum TaxID=2632390 RepID=UPI00029970FD|nr:MULTISPECIES: hypothetical protein [unclassified Sulfuricurvum]AFV97415.1 hypothetical protein B649_05505 [Candidatus Sulfuricurvum sp. RIFRC-1]HBM35111.1 hypothetical protein [Sulfuricurvum sp.]
MKYILLITLFFVGVFAKEIEIKFVKVNCKDVQNVLTFLDKKSLDESNGGYFCWDQNDIKIFKTKKIDGDVLIHSYIQKSTKMKVIDGLREDGRLPVEIYFYYYDLNNDGQKEIFVELEDATGNGLEWFILENTKNHLYRILDYGVGSDQNNFIFSIQDSSHNSYKDIKSYSIMRDKSMIFEFNGEKYNIRGGN